MTMITNIPSSAATVPIGRKFAAYLGQFHQQLAGGLDRPSGARGRTKMLFGFSDRQLRDIGICAFANRLRPEQSGKRD